VDERPTHPVIHATTILAVKRGGHVCIAGDGQVSVGSTVMKHGARKVRRLHRDLVVAGFAGASCSWGEVRKGGGALLRAGYAGPSFFSTERA